MPKDVISFENIFDIEHHNKRRKSVASKNSYKEIEIS